MNVKNLSLLCLLFCFITCKKEKNEPTTDQAQLEKDIINDFANFVVIPHYLAIQQEANNLKMIVANFAANPSDSNLSLARNAWKSVRAPWEKCEAFLFGPVEDFNYDPEIDSWPLSIGEMDSLLASTNALLPADIEALPTSLKGFHAIEYILFGISGNEPASQVTGRRLLYLQSLCDNLYSISTNLVSSWTTGNFATEWTTAGQGSSRFTTRKEALITLATALTGICEEVAGGKMEDPFIAQDSTLEESQFSNNTTTDFRNNIVGVSNAYFGKYTSDGHGLDELVGLRNNSLNQKIQSKINAASASLSLLNVNYGSAILTQHAQILDAQARIEDLAETIENELIPSLNNWISE